MNKIRTKKTIVVSQTRLTEYLKYLIDKVYLYSINKEKDKNYLWQLFTKVKNPMLRFFFFSYRLVTL